MKRALAALALAGGVLAAPVVAHGEGASVTNGSSFFANATFLEDDLYLVVWTGESSFWGGLHYASMIIVDERDPTYPVGCFGTTEVINSHYFRLTGAMVDADVPLSCWDGPDGVIVNLKATWTNNGSPQPTVSNEVWRDDVYGSYHNLYRWLRTSDVGVSVVISAGDVVVEPSADVLYGASLELYWIHGVTLPDQSS